MFPVREWFENEKSKKDAEWANKVIRFIRMNWQPLVSQDEAATGMSYLFGSQDMGFVKDLFQNVSRMNLTNERKSNAILNGHGQPIIPSTESDKHYLREMAALNFKSLPIMEKLRNVLVSEMKKMGPVVNVRSEDPTSTSKRIRDKELIEHKKEIEGLFSYIYTSIGQQPYTLKGHEARFGEKPDSGNVQEFEGMGLTPGDPTDISFFMDHFHKLDEEIAAEAPINFSMTYNRVIQEFEKWVNDIIAKKAIAATCYVSDVTGAIVYKYLAPETVWIYGGGNRQDFNDANAKGYERMITIKEMLDIIGNSFDMEQQFDNILLAISNINKVEFTGVRPSWRGFVTGTNNLSGPSNVTYTYDQFLSFKVNFGYIEFSSQNQETFGEVLQDDEDKGFYQNNQSPDGKYPSKARWETPTYRSYYLAVSQVDQVLFNYGVLPYQDILGSSDVSVNGTIITYKEPGDPISIIAAPFIDLMNEAWYKFRYELRRAKPRGRGWNYDSMVSTLMDLIPDTTSSPMNKLQKVMDMLDSSANEIYSFPKGPNGQAMPVAGNQLNYDIPNGISKETMEWWNIIISVGQYLSDLIGISDLRQGDSGGPRESMNNQFKALEYSQAATYYVPDMLTQVIQQLAIKTNFYVQDIITYKTYNTIAYKFLEDAIGEETISKLSKLGKVAPHRFGIFVESLNQGPMRQKLEGVMFEAVKNKTITTAEYMLISDIKSAKKAFLTFAYFEQRNKRLTEATAQALQKQQSEAAMAMKHMEVKIETMKIQGKLAEANIMAQAQMQSHLINQQGGLTKTKMKVDADREQVYHEAQANIYQEQQLVNETGKTTPPMPAPPAPQQQYPAQPPQGGAMPPQGQPMSEAAQLIQNAQPASTEMMTT